MTEQSKHPEVWRRLPLTFVAGEPNPKTGRRASIPLDLATMRPGSATGPAGQELYEAQSHFQTCAYAAEFSQRGAA